MKSTHAVPLIIATAVLALAGCSSEAPPTARSSAPANVEETRAERVEVPSVVGLTLTDASTALEAAGLTVDSIGTAGLVESQAPSAGFEVVPGTTVVLTVVDQAAEEVAAAATLGTLSQQNAYAAATNYLSFMPFSRAGLIQQLSSEYGEGYPLEDAEFAVSRLEAEGAVDWNAEATRSAQSYLETQPFSRQGLIDQLSSEYGEGFTLEQAEYGVSQAGL